MKKNLRNFLTLALGFVTIIATAQTWDADSRTRVNMSGDNDQWDADQRVSLSASWGGDGWGINVGGNANYNMQADNGDAAVGFNFYEASASTDLMGWATVSVGRQALEYGGGQLIGANDWGTNPQTRDGGVFTINNDMMDLDFGVYRSQADDATSEMYTDYFVNMSKSDGDWDVNLTYISNDNEDNAMAVDFGYAVSGVDLSVSYNTATNDGIDMDYTSIGGSYNVNDDMSISATRTAYGENGFRWDGSNMSGNWTSHGNMGWLGANDEDMAFGVSYDMGDVSLGLAMHKITNDANDDRSVTEANISYSMSDNANVSIKYATDDVTGNEEKYMWLTLSVTP
ncbi:MAG: porin [Bacteroidota bacterium]|nr:porin [Bacteroidota bacterium]